MVEDLKQKIENKYWESILETHQSPASIFKFCKDLGISEKSFYEYFSSFESIEGEYWEKLVNQTTEALDQDEETPHYDAKQRLLAFYFTFIEALLENRSRFTTSFPSMKNVTDWTSLISFDRAFRLFSESIITQAVEEGAIDDRKRLNDVYPHALLLQFKVILEFYRNDSSKQFQDTDAFIEKSVRFFFDGAKLPLIESGLDLIRFLVPRLRQL